MNEIEYIEKSVNWLMSNGYSIPDDIVQDLEGIGYVINDKPLLTDDELDEEKKFRSFAKRRIKEGKYADIPEYEFKFISEDKQKKLIEEYTALIMIGKLEKALQ